ncbi:immunoglobulin superfamily containing leucine-rich repeat protein-like, partial [Branchiostoma floridae]|uniref:Immunoglobulin superfamily containing leucine-rich repeat protein-like n=1 Tax=Branchiostoma floridae TaxID=7739 RepID=A0A9J7L976_BRAFL
TMLYVVILVSSTTVATKEIPITSPTNFIQERKLKKHRRLRRAQQHCPAITAQDFTAKEESLKTSPLLPKPAALRRQSFNARVFGSTEASCSISGSYADCYYMDLTSVPQDLPANITTLDLKRNLITTLSQSDFQSPNMFYRLNNLQKLWLDGNTLTDLSSDMFTGLENLQVLTLHDNDINDIQAGTFNSTTQLEYLTLYHNKLTNLRTDMFRGLATPQLGILNLENNKLTSLRSGMFTGLGNVQHLDLRNISNNPWQCDCRMVPFRQMMSGSTPWWSDSFENQITCDGPISRNLRGQKLEDMRIEDLICEEPTIVSFGKSDNNTVVEGETLYLVCEASGIPTPDITVTLPFGLNTTAESGGRVTVDVNGTITINNVTAAADAGLYVCIATSPVGSTFASLVVNVHLKVTTTGTMARATSLLPMADPSKKPDIRSSDESTPTLSIPVLVGSVCGALGVTLLVGTIILTIWCKRKAQNPSSGPPNPVVFSSAAASVTITGHDQTGQGGTQATSESLKDA